MSVSNPSPFACDYYRVYETYSVNYFKVLKDRSLRCMFAYRAKGALGVVLRSRIESKWGVNLGIRNTPTIGKGLYISHPYCIDVNTEATIGSNCNISKGVTIGKENRGKRKGAPIIGDDVWMGVNSIVVGKVSIGSDVMICPNSYVNFDVPDHSIVMGNLGKIIPREPIVTTGYINRRV